MDNTQWLQTFRESIGRLYDDIDAFGTTEPTPEDAADAIALMHSIKGDFTLAWDRMVGVVIDAMGTIPEVTLPDGTKVEKRQAADRKAWQHKDLAGEVATRITNLSVDMDTGERTMTTEQMITALLDYCAPSYWRVKALNGIGIDPDRFCEVSEGKTNIIVRKATNEL